MTLPIDRLPTSVPKNSKMMNSAAAEKMASFQTLDFLRREAALGKREDFHRYMAMVPDVPPQAGDAI